MQPISQSWMDAVAGVAEKIFHRQGAQVTLGGEPTYVPWNPLGAEWNYSAVGEEKLSKALAFADSLIANALPGGTVFFAPGKQYPGETNPRWALRILFSKQAITDIYQRDVAALPDLKNITRLVLRFCGIKGSWGKFRDPLHPQNEVRSLLLDHNGAAWQTTPWCLKDSEMVLVGADGPAGLRLPLNHLAPEIPRRALTLECNDSSLSIFFPPLLQSPFLDLLHFFRTHLPASLPSKKNDFKIFYQGYLPPMLDEPWQVIGLASDPGVLEVNLPPCKSWREYADWVITLDRCASDVGLRAWRTDRAEFPCGTGGGNHLLFGSPPGEPNCFYARPAWLASILTYWQRHPSLSYLFTGDYVGASSQAPRPDESGVNLCELELALADLRNGSDPPIPYFIGENLRHLLVDSSGNPHRAEISLDKFHDLKHPAGLLGLIEFRAIESMPRPEWTSAIALLWMGLLAMLLEKPEKRPLQSFGSRLHDRYFLPTFLLRDLRTVLSDLDRCGLHFHHEVFEKIWNWRFPKLLEWKSQVGNLEIRKAHESWPLLAEIPEDGGTTSRFVDTSLRRLEFAAPAGWSAKWKLFINGRELRLRPYKGESEIAGLRYRHACLHPSLHPRRPIQLPLRIVLRSAKTLRAEAAFALNANSRYFRKVSLTKKDNTGEISQIIPGSFPGAFTADLRF